MMLRHIILSKGMTREDLEEWHRPRMVALIEGKVSLLALETMPGSMEVILDFVAIFANIAGTSSTDFILSEGSGSS